MKKFVHILAIINGRSFMIHRYFLFLLVNVVFIFLMASTYWQLVRDLANSPAKIPEKLAQALQMGSARSEGLEISGILALMTCEQALFPLLRDPARWAIISITISFEPTYICLPGFGIMPLQLLNLGIIIPRVFYRLLITRTPRGNWAFLFTCYIRPKCSNRFRGAERPSCDKLRHRISSGNPNICDYPPI
jgi:hypothetical protein